MGLFDIFSRSGPGAIKKHVARAANKRAQNPDRWESLQALAAMRSEEAVEGLLGRFTIRVDPSIIDQEEKDLAFNGILEAGEIAIAPVKKFLFESDQVAWPLKMLEQLLSSEEVVEVLLELLGTMNTDYERDPEKKIQVVAYMEDRQDPRIVEAVAPFLDDMNETVRFHAAGAVFAQEEPDAAKDALLDCLAKEESVRVRARILDGFVQNEWKLPDDRRDELQKQMPKGYALDSDGTVRK